MKEKNAMAIILLFGINFLLFGIIIASITSSSLSGDFFITIFLNLFSSSILIVIVYGIYRYTGENPILKSLASFRNETKDMMDLIINSDTARQYYRETGVTRIIKQRGDTARKMWSDFINQDNEYPLRVEVLGKVLNRVQESFIHQGERDRIVEKILNGTRIYILMIDPGSDPARVKARDEGDATEHSTVGKPIDPKVVAAINDIITRTANNHKKGCLVVGYYSKTPYCQITRIGNEMLVTNYLNGHSGRECPSLLIKNKHKHSIFDIYRETFYGILEDTHIKSTKPIEYPILYQTNTLN